MFKVVHITLNRIPRSVSGKKRVANLLSIRKAIAIRDPYVQRNIFRERARHTLILFPVILEYIRVIKFRIRPRTDHERRIDPILPVMRKHTSCTAPRIFDPTDRKRYGLINVTPRGFKAAISHDRHRIDPDFPQFIT
jgi:hypothetical protein